MMSSVVMCRQRQSTLLLRVQQRAARGQRHDIGTAQTSDATSVRGGAMIILRDQ